MSFIRMFSRRPPIGVALDEKRMTASLPRVGRDSTPRLWTRTLMPAPHSGPWVDLAAAFRELREQVADGGMLFIALMPPFGRIRLIDLPGVSEAEAARVVRRDPSRFFPVRGEQLAVEVRGSGWRRSTPFVVAAAPHAIVEHVAEAAAASGWSLGGTVPAQLAWAALAGGPAPRDVVIRCADHVEHLRVARGTLIAARRLPAGRVAASADATTQAVVVESASVGAERAAALATRTPRPVLRSDMERLAVRRGRRRGAIARTIIAAAVLVVAGMLELRGLAHERGRLAMERRRIQPVVAQSMAVRESIAVAAARVALLRGADSSTRWSGLIAALAEELPSDAYLVSFTAEGDSVHLEGAALRAAPVFDAVNTMGRVRGVRPDGPIRQELRGAERSEHFLLSAFVSRASASTHGDKGPNANASGGRP